VFDGNRSKSEAFIQEFELYINVNIEAHVIANPYRRLFLALSYMKGPKIDDWVRLIIGQVNIRVNGLPNENPPVAPVNGRDDEDLWTWFVGVFRAAYTDTTKSEDALTKLLGLRMKDNDLDTYIATFNHLWNLAGWEQNSQGTVLLFRRGLTPGLVQAVINRTMPQPRTFEEWANVARHQHAIWIESRAVMGTQSIGRHDGFQNLRWQSVMVPRDCGLK
jgi:hypothetical protein